jgi:hypothetical protein
MRRKAVALFGAALLACAAVTVSCSDDDDPVKRACGVVVHECNAMSNMSACIDVVGYLSPPCVACIGGGGCNYFSDCQRADPTCLLPSELEP